MYLVILYSGRNQLMDYGTLSKKYAHGTTNMVTLQRTKGSNGRVNTGTAGYMLVTIVEQMLCVSLTDSLFFSFFLLFKLTK